MNDTVERARLDFTRTFGCEPTTIARAPGRVELLGNHTDYNDGLVLSAAIDRDTVVVGRTTTGPDVRLRSVTFDEMDRFPRGTVPRTENGHWSRYVRGALWALTEGRGLDRGCDVTIAGDVPLGAGLSSSASLQVAAGLFLIGARLVSAPGPAFDDGARFALAQAIQRAENQFVGVESGLLDPFSSLFGKTDHALFLDCRTLDHARTPLGRVAPAIVVCDSRTTRRLADGLYNQRRAECERVVAHFQALRGREAVRSLRDIELDAVVEHWDALDPIGRKRARHVLTENARVSAGLKALEAGDLETFGRLMSASHASSRDDFENSSPALDALIEAAETAPGFLGGKLSGAGWAGCTVNLVRAEHVDAFADVVRDAYARRFGIAPVVHACRAAEGAGVVDGPFEPA